MNKLLIDCPLCGEHSCHIVTDSKVETAQCIHCGYATSSKFLLNGKPKSDNEQFKNLPEEMQDWSKEGNGKVWIPTMMTLPFGMIYPFNEEGKMRWAFAEMVVIPKTERSKYPIEGGEGFHTQKYDTENQKVYDEFYKVLSEVNVMFKDKAKDAEPKISEAEGVNLGETLDEEKIEGTNLDA